MDQELKELIQLSIQSGKITQDNRELIYRKADEKLISKSECDIYINGYLNEKSEISKLAHSQNRNWGVWLIILGLIDIMYGFYLEKKPYGDEAAAICVLSGIIFLTVGAFRAGNKSVKKWYFRTGYLILCILVSYLLASAIPSPLSYFFGFYELDYTLYKIKWFTLSVCTIYFFRIKILGSHLGGLISKSKIFNFLTFFENKLPTSINNFLKKD